MIFTKCFLCILFSIISVSGKNNRGYNYEPPEVIANDPPDQFGGYNYPIPNPPFFDEPSTPSTLYGPSLDFPQPNITLPPIQNDIPDFPSYLPPTLEPPQFEPIPEEPPNQYLPPTTLYDAPKFRITNMSCLDSPTNSYFRANMGLGRSFGSFPVIDDAPADCISGSGDSFRLELEGERMRRCGVRFCSNGINMCVVVRMPTVRGLKLPEDPVVMLRCRPQERVVAHTKQLRINTINSVQQARSALPSTVISGGSQRGFDTQVALFRRGSGGPGDFSRLVSPGAAVQLGEELMLRAQVRDGDGWRSSRLSDVNIHHLSSGRVKQRAFALLDSAGCRDVRARSVVPQDVTQPTPLTSQLTFRAFMFQGMASGDEMVLSVRMLACLQPEDCQRVRACDSRRLRRRRRRHTNSSHATNSYNSFLEFRVVAPGQNAPETATLTNSTSNEGSERMSNMKPTVLITVLIGSMAAMMLGCVIVYVAKGCRK